MAFGGYRSMWIMAMFDLPTDTKAARKAYTNFRGALLDDGFTMMQFSVYARHCASEENADVHEVRVRASLPDDGEVRQRLHSDRVGVVVLQERRTGLRRFLGFHPRPKRARGLERGQPAVRLDGLIEQGPGPAVGIGNRSG